MSATVIGAGVVAPDHVPRSLVWDHEFNVFAAELDDPYKAVARLLDGPELIWARKAVKHSPGWVPTRHALVQEVFMDTEHFSTHGAFESAQLLGVDWQLNPVGIDPPAHMYYRQLLQPWFTPTALAKFEDRIRVIARSLFADIEHKGGCELIEDYMKSFPSTVFLEMVGLPVENLEQFLQWEVDALRGPTQDIRAAGMRSILAYLEAFADRRRTERRDDVIDNVLFGQIQGRALTYEEQMGMILLLYIGGLDTVLSSVSWAMRHLAMDQALQVRLREHPEDIPGAIEDFLRAYGVSANERIVKEDYEFHGVLLKKGDRISTPTHLAGRDPRAYANPDIVDPDRKARHLSFGTGVHNCLGAHLARREIKILLEEWLLRFKNIRLAPGERVEFRTTGTWNVSRLPLVWD